MGTTSIWHWLVVGLVVLLLFGRGRLPGLMADVAKGIKSFRTGLREDEPEAPPPAQGTAGQPPQNQQVQAHPPAQPQPAPGVGDDHKTRA